MTERLPCKSEGCKATILPATAAKTGGYCMPCHQAQERRKREAYIEKHRKTVNLYEGLTDPVEILKITHTPRKHDPLIQYVPYPLKKEQLFAALSEGEAGQMLDEALELLANGNEETSREILTSLVCYRNYNIAECLPELMECGMFRPDLLYKDAPPEVRDRLLERLEWDGEHRNSILLALSWIGDETVVRRFAEWRDNAPLWAETLYVSPEKYAQEAGWELDEEGKRRDLVHPLNYAIVRDHQVESDLPAAEEKASRFLELKDCTCPWCGGELTMLADLDAAHPSLAHLELKLNRLQFQSCVRCGCYGVIFMEPGPQGEPVWSSHNRKPDYLPDIALEDYDGEYLNSGPMLKISAEPRSPFYAAEWGMSQHDSQIGGYPSWVQDAEYPVCPCCGKSMRFIGQLDWADLEQYGEGIFYMFLCPEDQVTATLYQQS